MIKPTFEQACHHVTANYNISDDWNLTIAEESEHSIRFQLWEDGTESFSFWGGEITPEKVYD